MELAERERDHHHEQCVDGEGQQRARRGGDDQDPAREVRLADEIAVAGDGVHAVDVVASVKKVQATIAMSSCTGKSSVLAARFQQDAEDQIHDPEEHQRLDERPHVAQRGARVLQLEAA